MCSFVIGGDAVYVGRGWQIVGEHTNKYDNQSVGIAFIGDYTGQCSCAYCLYSGNCLDIIYF